MAPKSVSAEVCNARHDEIRRELVSLQTDLREIKDNHLPHLNVRLDNLQTAMLILGLIAGASLGIKMLELMKVIS